MSETMTPAKGDKSKANGTTPETALVVAEQGTAIAGHSQKQSGIIQYADPNEGIPDMDDMEIAPLDLASQYWTPEIEGEQKRLLFSHIGESLVPDKYGHGKNDPDATVKLETAHFFERKGDEILSVRQASKVLLSTLRSQGVTQGAMLLVIYKGKKKLSNGNTGDTWGVYPLVPKK